MKRIRVFLIVASNKTLAYCQLDFCLSIQSGGGGTPIQKLYGDVTPFRVIFYKQGLKITHFDEKMSGILPENHKQGINFPRFSRTFYHKQGQGFKVRSAPPYPNLGRVPPPPGNTNYNI